MRWEMECVLRPGVGLHKRTGPSISYRIVGKWYRGDKFIVVDTKTVGVYTWYKIEGTSYWSCGKEGSATYLKKLRDLDPPKPPDPPQPPKPPEPPVTPPIQPEPPYVPPDFGSNHIGSGFMDMDGSDWYIKPKPYDTPGDMQSRVLAANGGARTITSNGTMNPDVVKAIRRDVYSDNTPFDETHTDRRYAGKWDPVSDSTIAYEMRRIRYNMDIAYMRKDEIDSDYSAKCGYFTNLQAKIHNSFNRNKTAFPDQNLSKCFAYVFFTRPDLNLGDYSGGDFKMHKQTHLDDMYDYIYRSNPWTIKSLIGKGNPNHKFLVLLSNEAKSFEVSDKVIKTVEHGETFTGSKIMYGRTDHESSTAGEIGIRYVDNVNLDIFKLHEVWTDYINKVSRGEFSPKRQYIKDRILDYASSCYYFLCGPDGSTILYWQKLTGIFPISTGENVFSWDAGTLLSNPEVNIKYAYSMKTSMDVRHLEEFNSLIHGANARKIKFGYEQANVATGSTLTHSPFIANSTFDGRAVFNLVWLND